MKKSTHINDWGIIKGWFSKTYHGVKIELDSYAIFLIPEEVVNNFDLPSFTVLGTGTLRGAMDNDTTTRYKISKNGLGMIKYESGSISKMLKNE